MRKKHTYFVLYSQKLEQFLIDNKLQYEIVGDGILINKHISFSVFDDELIHNKLKRMVHSKPITINVFTAEELNNAAYLTMRPTRNVVHITNEDDACVYKCKKKSLLGNIRYGHEQQIKPFCAKKLNTKGRTVFFSPDSGFSSIFAKKEVSTLIEENNCIGLRYYELLTREGTGGAKTGLIQLSSYNTIPMEKIIVDNLKDVKNCPVCGQIKIICSTDYQLKLRGTPSDLGDDYYATDAIFGDGIPFPLYLVSHKLYALISEAGMCRNVVFEPVLFSEQKGIN